MNANDLANVARCLVAGGFDAKARSAAERALELDPRCAEAMEALGLIYRRLGELPAAAAAYRRLRQARPGDATVATLCAILDGAPPPAAPAGHRQPAPFVVIDGFLPSEPHSWLLGMVERRDLRRTWSRVGEGRIEPAKRFQFTIMGIEDVRSWFLPRVEAVFGELGPRLGLSQLAFENVELSLTTSPDGAFFSVHKDSSPEVTRLVSFAYFFHRQPPGFSGGDLLLFDTVPSTNLYGPSLFTRIRPVDNRIVFFPSAYYHEVTRVRCDAGAVVHTRLALNGHIWGTGTRPPERARLEASPGGR